MSLTHALEVAGCGGISRPGRIQDLAEANWILHPDGCAAPAALRQGLLRLNLEMRVAVETYNYELLLALVASNRGLSLVPERSLFHSRFKHPREQIAKLGEL